MSSYDLPTSVDIKGTEYKIRNKGDYRVILDVLSALNDNDMEEQSRVFSALYIFYEEIPDDLETAIKQMYLFINVGEEDNSTGEEPQLVDWNKDVKYMFAPINRVAGKEIRAEKYLHWYTFMSLYMEMGECYYSHIIQIRQKRQKHQNLDDWEKEFYRQNADKIDMINLTEAEKAFFSW